MRQHGAWEPLSILRGISTLFVQRFERNIKLDKSLAESGANPTVLRSLGVERDTLAPAFHRESKSYRSGASNFATLNFLGGVKPSKLPRF